MKNSHLVGNWSLSFNIEGSIVKNAGNSGLNTLRNVLLCAMENSTITFDQPAISGSTLTTSLPVTKNVTIMELNSSLRPLITLPMTSGMTISAGKILTLDNVDLKSTTNNATNIYGPGTLNIIGVTEIKK